jgi:1,6-anhydro-N-acetylmuramate kinase
MQHIIHCPQPDCGASAQVVDRWVWLSTHGPVEHVKTWCTNGHGFTPTLDTLTAQPTPNLPPEPAVDATVG